MPGTIFTADSEPVTGTSYAQIVKKKHLIDGSIKMNLKTILNKIFFESSEYVPHTIRISSIKIWR